jgi:hypothetical protein
VLLLAMFAVAISAFAIAAYGILLLVFWLFVVSSIAIGLVFGALIDSPQLGVLFGFATVGMICFSVAKDRA